MLYHLSHQGSPKLAPKNKKKRSWSLFGGLLPVWSTTVFWILAKPLHLRSMISKSMRCTKSCNTCSWHWSTERTTTMPDQILCNQHFKSWRIELQSFASSAIFTWPLINWLPPLQASRQPFPEKILPTLAGGRNYFPRVHRITEHRFLCYRNKQTYFSLAKMCLL